MLNQLRSVHVGQHDGSHERLINLLHQGQRAIAIRSDNDSIWIHQVGDSASFPEKFRIADHIKINACLVISSDSFGHLFPGFDRNGALVDDDAIFLEYVGDLACNSFDVGEVNAAVWLRWSGACNENNLGMLNAIFHAVRESHPARGNVALNDFLQSAFVHRYMPDPQGVDLSLVVVHADNTMADIGQAGTSHQTDIS